MERTMSVEDKIRRAEEIYARRRGEIQRKTTTVSINNNNNRKDIKLLRKMIIQIALSLLIYSIIYIIQNNNYIFSKDFLNKANEILSYDMNFEQIYENTKISISEWITDMKKNMTQKENGILTNNENEINNESMQNKQENETNNQETNGIGGAIEEQQTSTENLNETQEQSQEEKDIAKIKATTTLIKPIEGTISSKYGQREPTTATVPKNHTGVDIAANLGTKIKSATEGEVVIASEEGDYGKHLKIQIGEVSIIYAHCNKLYVKQGDKINQGQEIAEVGSTGNSTGPHLHFEIRISEKTIDPQKILEL